ncbi:hypothetical protein HNY73_013995 [Argiope bruennichi]|uniref:Uncharacterized protein n=1 Tax=Argiope bruennichi TaxID=94029 RepID=A0A8T0EMN9_ARGBR|nr:hypothetical protein HNY73_013995 [Argiope bruennichi]
MPRGGSNLANRIADVQEKSNPNDWLYCPSADNPTNLLTRGISVENLIYSKMWSSISSFCNQTGLLDFGCQTIHKKNHETVIYALFRAELSRQIIADLPSFHVVPGRALLRTGTDFCGPFVITPRHERGVRPREDVPLRLRCFITKVVHLELVSDLNTDAFLASFKRFIGC